MFEMISNWFHNHNHHHNNNNKMQKSTPVPIGDYSEILDGFLYLSDIVFIQEAHLTKCGITEVCSVTTKIPLTPLSLSINRLSLPVDDNSHFAITPHFDTAHAFIEKARASNKKVVVHCEVGMSRSPTIVISYLMKHHGMSLRSAFKLVRDRRPIVKPNMGFIKQLLTYERSIFGKPDNMFLAEYVKESYVLDFTKEQVLEALERENLDINRALFSLYPS